MHKRSLHVLACFLTGNKGRTHSSSLVPKSGDPPAEQAAKQEHSVSAGPANPHLPAVESWPQVNKVCSPCSSLWECAVKLDEQLDITPAGVEGQVFWQSGWKAFLTLLCQLLSNHELRSVFDFVAVVCAQPQSAVSVQHASRRAHAKAHHINVLLLLITVLGCGNYSMEITEMLESY